MTPARLALLARLAALRDQQAARAVRDRRTALDAARQQADMLRDYRRSMSPARWAGGATEAGVLQSAAAFAEVAEQAQSEARAAVQQSEQAYREALNAWWTARHRADLLERRHDDSRRREARAAGDREDVLQQAAQSAGTRDPI